MRLMKGVRGRGGVIMKSESALCHLARFHLVHSFIYLGHWGIRTGFQVIETFWRA